MIKVHTRVYDETKSVDKNALYKINKSTRVVFKEQHEKSQEDIPTLLFLKLQNNLKPYEKEIPRLYDFAEQKIKIAGKLYKLRVYLLTKKDECCYQITIEIKADGIVCNE